MTTNAECAAAVPVLNKAAAVANLAVLGGGSQQTTNPFTQVTDGNANTTVGPNLTAAAAALLAISTGGAHNVNTSAQYLAWQQAAQTAQLMAEASGDRASAVALGTAVAILGNLVVGQ